MEKKYWLLSCVLVLVCTGCKVDFKKNEPVEVKEGHVSVDQLEVIDELPNPFCSGDSVLVTTKEQWMAHREDLKEKVQLYEYGFLGPASPVKLVKKNRVPLVDKNGKPFNRLEYELTTGPDNSLSFRVDIFTLDKIEGPLPAIVVGDLCWGSQLQSLRSDGMVKIMEKGYLIVEFDRTRFALDEENRFSGVYPCYPEYSWGALAAWAWGYHRVVDFLEGLEFVDDSKIIVTGFSRGGKAALLAGALDERIALVNPNCSGTCGSGPIRYIDEGAETIDAIVKVFPFWFSPNFQRFTGENRNRLPFDQHTLISLVAPRAYYSTNGLKDTWANPKGTAQAHLAATEVYKALGAQDKIGIYFADTGHDHNLDKWLALIDFADKVFCHENLTKDDNKIPFEDLTRAFCWTAPTF